MVIDEFHHAMAPTYRRLLDHLQPQHLLGLTATPERGDGVDVARQLFDGRIMSRRDTSSLLRLAEPHVVASLERIRQRMESITDKSEIQRRWSSASIHVTSPTEI